MLWPDVNWIIYSNDANYAVYAGSKNLSAKEFAQKNGLK